MKTVGSGPSSSADVEYTPYNNVPMGATHHKGRLFVTMPRRRTGIPSTLNYIDMSKAAGNQSPRLRAYPNLEVNTLNVSINDHDLYEENDHKIFFGVFMVGVQNRYC